MTENGFSKGFTESLCMLKSGKPKLSFSFPSRFTQSSASRYSRLATVKGLKWLIFIGQQSGWYRGYLSSLKHRYGFGAFIFYFVFHLVRRKENETGKNF